MNNLRLPPRRCSARKRNGDPCGAPPMKGKAVCKSHSEDPDIGRRSKLTLDVQEKICEALKGALYMVQAAEYAGVSESVVYDWLKIGEADRAAGCETPFLAFLEAVTRVSIEVELRASTMWQASFAKNPGEIGKFLAARYPGRWGRSEQHRRQPPGGVVADLLGGHQPVDLPISLRNQIAELIEENAASQRGTST